MDLNVLAKTIHDDNVAKGFWPDDRLTRNIPEAIALMHSEVSEAWQAEEDGTQDDKLPQYPGVAVEVADGIIRALDILHAFAPEIDLNADIASQLPQEVLGRISNALSSMSDIELLHYLLSEALEKHRKGGYWQLYIAAFTQVSFQTFIDYGTNYFEVIDAKLAYNRSRPFKHGKGY